MRAWRRRRDELGACCEMRDGSVGTVVARARIVERTSRSIGDFVVAATLGAMRPIICAACADANDTSGE